MVSVKLDEKICTSCKTCVEICPMEVFEINEKKYGHNKPIVKEEKCIACRACEAQCPVHCIEINDE